jgi:hypothetical protein
MPTAAKGNSLTVADLEAFLASIRANGGRDDTQVMVQTKTGSVKKITRSITWGLSGYPHLITD